MEGEGVGGDKKQIIRAFGAIDIIYEPRMVTLEWIASPCNDMFADAVLSAVLQVTSREKYGDFTLCDLGRVFGQSQVPATF